MTEWRSFLGIAASALAGLAAIVAGFVADRRFTAVGALSVAVLLSGCAWRQPGFGPGSAAPSAPPAPSASQLLPWETDNPMVIVGYKNHRAILEPLVEIEPAPGPHDATVEVRFKIPRRAGLLGIEGALGFLRADDAGGKAVLDREVEIYEGGSDVTLSPGTYRLEAYYRPCDGNCGLLDPAQSFCSADLDAAADARYRLTVAVDADHSADCTLQLL